MVTLDLSRVDRKAQGPLELVSYWSLFGPTPSHTLKPNWKAQLERPNRPAQLDSQIVIKGEMYRNLF